MQRHNEMTFASSFRAPLHCIPIIRRTRQQGERIPLRSAVSRDPEQSSEHAQFRQPIRDLAKGWPTGFDSRQGQEAVLLSSVQTGSRVHSASCPGAATPAIKWQEQDADRSTPSAAEVMNGADIPTPPYAFRVCALIQNSGGEPEESDGNLCSGWLSLTSSLQCFTLSFLISPMFHSLSPHISNASLSLFSSLQCFTVSHLISPMFHCLSSHISNVSPSLTSYLQCFTLSLLISPMFHRLSPHISNASLSSHLSNVSPSLTSYLQCFSLSPHISNVSLSLLISPMFHSLSLRLSNISLSLT
jgi:hypothetical protein